MKVFEFSLERMYHYKEQVLNKEKNLLAQLRKRKDGIEAEIVEREQYSTQKKVELQARQLEGTTAMELSSDLFMIENTKLQIAGLHRVLRKAEEEVAYQLTVVIAASREIAGLEKLEEKQREEYNKQVLKDDELQVLEHITSALVRGQEQL